MHIYDKPPERLSGLFSKRLQVLLIYLLPLLCIPALGQEDAAPVKLVVAIVVDQLRADRLNPDLPGGLGRLYREGLVFTNATLDHAITNTCPGHAVVLSGLNPNRTGILGNTLFRRDWWQEVYCVSDDAPDAQVPGQDFGRSPRLMRATTLGDWLKDSYPGTRVFSISAKDRAAITLGGQKADLALWFDRDQGRVVSSRYYLGERSLPDWLQPFNGTAPLTDGYLSRLPEQWIHETAGSRPDDFSGEDAEYSRTSPHPLANKSLNETAEQFYTSPYIDELVADLAVALLEAEKPGSGPTPDLLALSFSATDTVGHRYGPYSAESADTLARLDQQVGRLMDVLYQRFTPEEVIIILTADHGVLPLPEATDQLSEGEQCSAPSSRVSALSLIFRFYGGLWWKFSSPFGNPFNLVTLTDGQVHISSEEAEARGTTVAAVQDWVEQYLESLPYIQAAWNAEELSSDSGEMARLYRNSHNAERGGDLMLQPAAGCLIGSDTGTAHGTPYRFDRHIPLIFDGGLFTAEQREDSVHSVDIAPTLAPLLGIKPPQDLDGHNLLCEECPP